MLLIEEFTQEINQHLNAEDALMIGQDIAVYIWSQNEESKVLDPYTLEFHDLDEVTEIVRAQETDSEGNWLHKPPH